MRNTIEIEGVRPVYDLHTTVSDQSAFIYTSNIHAHMIKHNQIRIVCKRSNQNVQRLNGLPEVIFPNDNYESKKLLNQLLQAQQIGHTIGRFSKLLLIPKLFSNNEITKTINNCLTSQIWQRYKYLYFLTQNEQNFTNFENNENFAFFRHFEAEELPFPLLLIISE